VRLVSAVFLRIEKGRHTKGNRICKHCSLEEVEDECHFLIVCPAFHVEIGANQTHYLFAIRSRLSHDSTYLFEEGLHN
jgi:hypothetical protein